MLYAVISLILLKWRNAMDTKKAIRIIQDEKDLFTQEEVRDARIFLLKNKVLRIHNGSYQIQAKNDPFTAFLLANNPDKWMFCGGVTKWDEIPQDLIEASTVL